MEANAQWERERIQTNDWFIWILVKIKLHDMTWHNTAQRSTQFNKTTNKIPQTHTLAFTFHMCAHSAQEISEILCTGHMRKKLLRSSECILPCTWYRIGYEVLNLSICHSSQTLHKHSHTHTYIRGEREKERARAGWHKKRLPFVRHHMYKLKLDRFGRNGKERIHGWRTT